MRKVVFLLFILAACGRLQYVNWPKVEQDTENFFEHELEQEIKVSEK
jgi:hypothetical protein